MIFDRLEIFERIYLTFCFSQNNTEKSQQKDKVKLKYIDLKKAFLWMDGVWSFKIGNYRTTAEPNGSFTFEDGIIIIIIIFIVTHIIWRQ